MLVLLCGMAAAMSPGRAKYRGVWARLGYKHGSKGDVSGGFWRWCYDENDINELVMCNYEARTMYLYSNLVGVTWR